MSNNTLLFIGTKCFVCTESGPIQTGPDARIYFNAES